MVLMHGKAFDESGDYVERQVPDVDVVAFERAGYVKGALPEHLKPKSKAGDSKSEVDDSLPDDFPGVTVLREANISTFAELKAVEDFTSIKGIGKATAEKISAELNK